MRSQESRIKRANRCHLASQFLTLGGGCLEVSFDMCRKSKPRLSTEVCDDSLAMSAMGLGGGSRVRLILTNMRSSDLLHRVLILTSSPRGGSKKLSHAK